MIESLQAINKTENKIDNIEITEEERILIIKFAKSTAKELLENNSNKASKNKINGATLAITSLFGLKNKHGYIIYFDEFKHIIEFIKKEYPSVKSDGEALYKYISKLYQLQDEKDKEGKHERKQFINGYLSIAHSIIKNENDIKEFIHSKFMGFEFIELFSLDVWNNTESN